jgi:cytochrome c oxidase assembly protein subunit 15
MAELREEERSKVKCAVQTWLWIGVGMLLVQFVLGSVTRLTGSGLSITKWEIAIGAIPPLNAIAWNEAFDLYKQTPQYHKINQGMSLSQFKFIYFWEYTHRLWARSMGLVFVFPFFYFWKKKWLDAKLKRQLLTVVLLAAVVGAFGWIMVASGLVNRPWVNAYKLTLHLNLAFIVYGYLLWVALSTSMTRITIINNDSVKKWSTVLFICLVFQLLLGGIMSGMKAGLFYPTWPDYAGSLIPNILLSSDSWRWVHLTDYDTHLFAPAFFNFLHRNLGYIISIIGLILFIKSRKINSLNKTASVILGIIFLQICLGVLVLLYSNHEIPVLMGVLHQLGAISLLSVTIIYKYKLSSGKSGVF